MNADQVLRLMAEIQNLLDLANVTTMRGTPLAPLARRLVAAFKRQQWQAAHDAGTEMLNVLKAMPSDAPGNSISPSRVTPLPEV
jgi:hypothetical protein